VPQNENKGNIEV